YNRIRGIFTDGDLRRMFDRSDCDIHTTRIQEVMTANCVCIAPEMMAAEALQIMEHKKISVLLVTEPDKHLIGALHMHDLLLAGVV
ncbi:MAG: CBS domain-containing protein, partial [Methylococcales bacterium]